MIRSFARRWWPAKARSFTRGFASYWDCEPRNSRLWRLESMPESMIDNLFVFLLATFIGLGVITRVSRLLHTPLMSLTNAISAIAVVRAIAVAGSDHPFSINLLGAIGLFGWRQQ